MERAEDADNTDRDQIVGLARKRARQTLPRPGLGAKGARDPGQEREVSEADLPRIERGDAAREPAQRSAGSPRGASPAGGNRRGITHSCSIGHMFAAPAALWTNLAPAFRHIGI